MRRPSFRVLVALLALGTAAFAGGCSCSSTAKDIGLRPEEWRVYGDQPVSVVEGYFAAWEHDAQDLREDLVDTSLVELPDEPPTTVERLSVFMTEGDSYRATCRATFELIQVVGGTALDRKGTVERSRHTWVFDLTFYEDRGSYIITGIQRD